MQPEIIVIAGIIFLMILFLIFSYRSHSRQRKRVQELCAKEFPSISYKKHELDSSHDSSVEDFLKEERFQANPELKEALRKLRIMHFGRILTLFAIILLIVILAMRLTQAF
ncbi:MAG TPA: hypothetical protein VJ461_00650 [Candidatus Nanoarchaeia archaeon]|nr:hypothetical protein [Candidatus Nanoarchaeia archaeon]